jgi:D-amino-acid oxidase
MMIPFCTSRTFNNSLFLRHGIIIKRRFRLNYRSISLLLHHDHLHSSCSTTASNGVRRSSSTETSKATSNNSIRKVLVVGSGAIGLRTAWELIQTNRVEVILQSPRHPLHPSTCSMGAGGLWMPYHIHPDDADDTAAARIEHWSIETLDELINEFVHSSDTEKRSLVEVVPAIYLKREHAGPKVQEFQTQHYSARPGGHTQTSILPSWTRDPRIQFQHLAIEMLCWQNELVHRLRIPPLAELTQAGYRHAWFFRPPIVDCPRMLEYMLRQVSEHAAVHVVDVEMKTTYANIQEMKEAAARLGCDAVINCTGLGAKQLCNNDPHMTGARGILLQYDRSACTRRRGACIEEYDHDAVIMTEDAPWGSDPWPCYMIPRKNIIVVGGSYLENEENEQSFYKEPRSLSPEERQRLLENASRLGIDVERARLVGEWTGLRPVRNPVRCEKDDSDDGVIVFHSYGYGGSGWTVNVGAAKECVKILLGEK